jgi:predicted transcriptional regulator of viral defense system
MTTLAFHKKLAGLKLITTRGAAEIAGVTIPAASKALARLAADGLSSSLKKGSWFLGSALPPPGILVAAAADPYMAYLSGWSALRFHDRIQQIPQTHFAVTLGRPGDVEMTGGRVALHRMKPELFGDYAYELRADGFVASAEKALFDLAYLAAMNRSRVSGTLPETDLKGLRWKEVRSWVSRIPTARIRAAVERSLRSIREQQAGLDD